MDINAIVSFIGAKLGIGSAAAILVFLAAVAVDDVLGYLLALKLKQYDSHKLGSFLESQLGTKRFLVVLGSVVAAVAGVIASPLGPNYLPLLIKAALAVAIIGSLANLAALISDIKAKVIALAVSRALPGAG